MKNTLLLCICLLNTIATVNGQDNNRLEPVQFYSGPIAIDQLKGVIQISPDGAPRAEFSVDLNNGSDKEDVAAFGFRGKDSQPVSLRAKQSSSLKTEPAMRRSGEQGAVQSAVFDLLLYANNQLVSQPVSATDIQAVLAPNIQLIRANMAYERSSNQSGETVLRFTARKSFPTELVLVYATDGVGLTIEKTFSKTPVLAKDKIKVTLKITNAGKNKLDKIVVEDDYDSRDFKGEGPGFSEYSGKENDRRLLYRTEIPVLNPGESREVSFEITAQFDIKHVTLPAASASSGNRLLGVSNKIKL